MTLSVGTVGSEFTVNTSGRVTDFSSVTVLTNGNLVVAWEDRDANDVRGRIYDSTGTALAGSDFQLNTDEGLFAGDGASVKVAALPGGGFQLLWGGGDAGGTEFELFTRSFDASGTPQDTVAGPEDVQIANGDPMELYTHPFDIVGLPSDKSAIAWTYAPDLFTYVVDLQVIDAEGNQLTTPVQVSTSGVIASEPSVTYLTNGNIVVSWDEDGGAEINARIYSYDGTSDLTPVTSAFTVNSNSSGSVFASSVTALAGGGFVVVWEGYISAGNPGAYGQIYDASGNPVGTQFTINSTTGGQQTDVVVTALTGGGFAVAWTDSSHAAPDTDGGAVRARVYDSHGDAVGNDFVVNTTTSGNQTFPDIAALSDGGFIVTYTDRTGQNILAQRYSVTNTVAAPTVVDGNAVTLTAIDEDTPNPAGDTVQNLFASHFSDADSNFAGVAITHNAATTEGTWQYSTDGTTWSDIGSPDTANAVLLGATALVRFLPAANYNGAAPLLTTHLADDAAGALTTGDTADLSTTGGNTPYSIDVVTLGETINPVNDAPVLGGGGNTASYVQHQANPPLIDAAITVSDVDGGNLTGATVKISSGFLAGDELNFTNQNGITGSYDSATGVLTLTGLASVANYQTALRSITYSSSSDHPDNFGTDQHRTIDWQVNDGAPSRFAAHTDYAVTGTVKPLLIADVNGDGKPDLLTSDPNASMTVSVLVNNGDGTFAATQSFDTGYGNTGLVVGDFNEDGKQDLITSQFDSGTSVSLLLGNGDGTFQAHQDVDIGTLSTSIASGDLNGDHHLDFVVTNDDGLISVLLGNGDGTFQPRTSISVSSSPSDINLVDIDGDGKLDIAFQNGSVETVLLGNGDGTFQAAQDSSDVVGFNVAFGDVNGDGKLDLVTTHGVPNSIWLMLGNGDGTFQSAQSLATGPTPTGTRNVALADINGDGKLDIVASNPDAFINSADNNFSILYGNGDGTFQTHQDFSTGSERPGPIVIGDLNGDNATDLAMAMNFGSVGVWLNGTTGPSNIVHTTVDVTAVNGPANTVPGTQSLSEDGSLAIGGLSVADPDAGSNTITTTLSVAHGTLTIASASGAVVTDSGTGTVTLTGTVTDINTTLSAANNVLYAPDTNFNGADTLTITTDDGGNNITSKPISDIDTVTINIGAVNDAPVASGAATLTAIDEDNTNPSGAAISSLFATNFSDAADQVTSGSSADTLAGIAISGNAATATEGKWQWSSDGSTWNDISTGVSASSALVLTAALDLRFLPTSNWNGSTPALTAHLIDSSASITNDTTVDLTTAGTAGTTQYSSATVVLTEAVNAINDAPVASGSATLAAIDEDTPVPAGDTIADLFGGNFSDETDHVSGGSSANVLAGIAITGNAATATEGTWQWSDDGTNWTDIGNTVSDSNALVLTAAMQLRFMPTADWNGTTPAPTAHLIDDSAAIANDTTVDLTSGTGGTTQYSSGTVALTEVVNAINDAPVASGSATLAAIDEDTAEPSGATITSLFSANFSDATDHVSGGSEANAFAGIAITGNAATATEGTWQWSSDGTNWTDIDNTVSDSNALVLTAATQLRFLPTADWNGTTPALTAHLIDDSAAIANDTTVDLTGGTGDATQYSLATVALTETVTAMNDPVTASAPATATLAEDDSVAITGLSIADVDAALAPNGVYEVTLSASHGTLTLSTLTGLTFTAGDGTSNGTMTFHGTLSDINTALATASYAGDADYSGSDTIAFSVTDEFNSVVATGSGSATSDSQSIDVTITAENDPVTASAPSTLTPAEDVSTAISGLSIADVDATTTPSGVYEVTLSASNGTLTLSTLTSLTFTAGDGTSDATMTFHGTLSDINAALATASYTGAANYYGTDTISFSVTDEFNSVVATGTGSATSDSQTIAVTVTAVNDPVTASAPATASLSEDSSVAITGLSIADADTGLAPNGIYEVTLSADHGTLTLSTLTGLTFTAGDGTSNGTMTFHGTLGDINTALATASYAGDADYSGSDTIAFSVTDEFNSVVATGSGSARSDSQSIDVTITAENDLVTASAPASLMAAEDTSIAISGLSIADVDAVTTPSGVYEVTLSASNGTLTLSTLTGLTFTAGDGTSDGTMTFHGTLSDINAALATASYTGAADYYGTDTIAFSVTDEFNSVVATGIGSATSDSRSISVTVTEVNDAPLTVDDTLSSVTEDSGQRTILGATLTGNDSAGPADESGQTLTVIAVSDVVGGVASVSGGDVLFTPDADFNGVASFTYTVTDDGTTAGSTAPKTATGSASFAVTAVNDPVTASAPSSLSLAEDASLAISGLAIADVDATLAPSGVYEVTLSASHGALTLGSHSGLTFTAGDGSADAAMTFHGTLAAINTALATARYAGAADYNGADTIAFSVTDSFNSVVASGSDSATSDSKSIAVTVSAVDDAPVNTVPGAQTASGEADLAIAGISVSDVDAGSGTITTTLSVAHGTLTVASAGGAAVTGSGTGSVVLSGTVTAINTTLSAANNVLYHSTDGFSGTNTLTVATNDNGHSGAGGPLSDTDTISIDVHQNAGPYNWEGSPDLGARAAPWQVAGVGDFNHDGTSDILWINTQTGQLDEWHIANGEWAASTPLGSHGTDWQVAGIGDFNHDGTSDILWRNPTTGHLDEWSMADGNWASSTDLGSHGTDWQVAGIGDFNGDGTSDVLWRNPTTGHLDEWSLANGNWASSTDLGSHGTDWQVAGVGDFNHDGTSDILWRNPTTGHVDLWLMHGGNWSGSVDLGSFNAAWQVAAVNDFNGDGTADVLWRNPTTGQVDGWVMQNGNWAASVSLGSFDPAYQVAGSGDFNHDHSADLLWRNPAGGQIGEWLVGSH